MADGDALRLVRVANGPWRVVFQRRYGTPPERVWQAITDPNGGFWRPDGMRIDPRVGGEVAIDFGSCDGEDGWAIAQITACEQPRLFAYRATPDAPEARWSLRPDGHHTLLTFRPAEAPMLVIVTGWHATLDNLARALAEQPLLSNAEFAAREAEVAQRYRSLPGVT